MRVKDLLVQQGMVKVLYEKQPKGIDDMDWKDLEANLRQRSKTLDLEEIMSVLLGFNQMKKPMMRVLGVKDLWQRVIEASVNSGFVMMGNDASCKVAGIGNIIIKMFDDVVRTLCDVRHVHELRKNLISLGTLDCNRFSFKSTSGVMKVSKGRNIYKLLGTTIVGGVATVESESDNTVLWHMRLGHMGECGMMELHKRNLLKGIKTCKLDLCKYCVFGKQNKVLFKTTTHKTEGVLDYVHTNVWGPVRVASLGGSMYFVSFIDDYSRKIWVYFMRHKSETFAKFKLWKVEIMVLSIQIQSSWNCVSSMGLRDTSQARCLILNAGLEKKFWVEAVNMACYLINRSPRAALDGKVAREVWTSSLVDYSGLRVFGGERLQARNPKANKVVISRDVRQYSQEKSRWMGATVEKIRSLHKNQTWDLVELLEEKRAIGCKWDEKFKARLVTKEGLFNRTRTPGRKLRKSLYGLKQVSR
ncbi:hypothetical protein AAG906_020022 [Vitis piasezkii]